MARLINAPHLADQPHEPYSDIFILAGRKAWRAWDNGKGEEWLFDLHPKSWTQQTNN